MHEEPLLASSFLFQFALSLKQAQWKWSARGASPKLKDEHRIPCLRQLDEKPVYADVRGAWSPQGVLLQFDVTGKTQPPWCRPSRLSESDGVQVWLATRDTHNIHRAGRFCHRFIFLPAGHGPNGDEPFAATLPIARARENPAEPPEGALQVASQLTRDGYSLQVQIAQEALTSYDPGEHNRISLAYAVIDRELGWQTMALGPEFPFAEDPSLWTTVELVAG
jgi:hypothetical protein